MMRWLTPVLRTFFCVLMTTTAIGKLLDNRGFAEVIATYQFGIPEPVLLPLALSVSLFELGLGLAILARLKLRGMAQLVVAVHAGYLALAAITNLRGLHLTNCGCFGVFLARPMTWMTVVEDAILLALALGFLWTATARSDTSTQGSGEATAAA